MKRLNIFKSGRHVTSGGKQIEFTEDDLSATAKAYDPDLHEAPIVIGHPKTNAPAFGWVKDLQSSDGSLSATPHQVNSDFEELVRNGSYKKISASFYEPTAPSNPTPGVWALRHVGFLGAQAPAVKGLAGVEFDENEEGVVTFEDVPLKSWQLSDIKDIFRNLREWFISEKGKDAADGIIPDYMINDLEPAKPDNPLTTNFNEDENMTPEELKKKEKDLSAERIAFEEEKAEFAETKKADPNPDRPEGENGDEAAHSQFAEQDKKIANLTAQLERKDFAEFVEGLVASGQVLPRDKDNLVGLMAVMPKDTAVDFAEGDSTSKTPALAAFKQYLKALPPVVNFSEITEGSVEEKTDEYKELGKQIANA